MGGHQKKITQVCKCENCGNEAEMVITCTLHEESHEHKPKRKKDEGKSKVKGVGTCSKCGNEAEMWIDM
ncbi:MAG: hypothetical protein AB1659_04450 [Thermodesulfobacteriota bacterium]